jgi:2-methylisocitrate lyase-like PEP mutase family enzyme
MKNNSLREKLDNNKIILVPGIYDSFGALMAEKAGFEALYVSGASISYTKLGSPDLGFVSMSEVAAIVGNISERTSLPLIVDADTGFGNALNVQRTIKVFEKAGASAIQIEDQLLPKRCGHLDGKRLITDQEMCGKIKAALDSRVNSNTLIIARTDAVGVEGFESALDRAQMYYEAGADILFIEAIQDEIQIAEAMKNFGKKVPLLANMVEGGKTPLLSAPELEKLGFSIVIFPGGLVRAFARTAQEYFKSLYETGSTKAKIDEMYSFDELNQLLGTKEILEMGKTYDTNKK